MEKQRQSATDRHAQLVALVKGRGYCSVVEMSQILNVSPMTIRRDLSILQEKHIVEVMYGGARFIASNRTEPDFTTRSLEHLAAKQAIGKQAADGDSHESSNTFERGIPPCSKICDRKKHLNLRTELRESLHNQHTSLASFHMLQALPLTAFGSEGCALLQVIFTKPDLDWSHRWPGIEILRGVWV